MEKLGEMGKEWCGGGGSGGPGLEVVKIKYVLLVSATHSDLLSFSVVAD